MSKLHNFTVTCKLCGSRDVDVEVEDESGTFFYCNECDQSENAERPEEGLMWEVDE